jgi:lysophospholipase L1-like esterase
MKHALRERLPLAAWLAVRIISTAVGKLGASDRGRRRATRILGPLAAAAAVIGIAAPQASAAEGSFVALGDSYAAGPLIPAQVQPYGCLKSNNNYGSIAQRQLKYAQYRDMTCSGAETEDMTQAQGVSPGPNPPQFDALDAGTRLVTLTIGGNDIGFSGIAQDCIDTTPANTGHPCMDKYVVNGVDEVSRRISETAPKVAAVLQGIRARSPQARILVVNYPAIFPHNGNVGCWPQIPVADGDVAWLRSKQVELNSMIADQVTANGAQLVDAYTASRGHDACKLPLVRWLEPAIPASAAAPIHPNLQGMQAMAKLVVTAARGLLPLPLPL